MDVPTESRAPLDESVLTELMRQVGDDDGCFRVEMIRTYLSEATDQIGRFVTATQANDAPTVAAVAHTLRSTSALLGAGPLAELLGRAEQRALNGPSDLHTLGYPVQIEFARVAQALGSVGAHGA